MAEQVLQGADADYKLGQATVDKIRSWSLESPFLTEHPSPLSASRG